jgi:hypothetical protein
MNCPSLATILINAMALGASAAAMADVDITVRRRTEVPGHGHDDRSRGLRFIASWDLQGIASEQHDAL